MSEVSCRGADSRSQLERKIAVLREEIRDMCSDDSWACITPTAIGNKQHQLGMLEQRLSELSENH